MDLSNKSKHNLKEKGISLKGAFGYYQFYKVMGVAGNKISCIPPSNLVVGRTENKKPIAVLTDCPVLILLPKGEKWLLHCSEFAPSPGPGDFSKEFHSESKLIDFVINYYTEKNESFEALLKYCEEYAKDKNWK